MEQEPPGPQSSALLDPQFTDLVHEYHSPPSRLEQGSYTLAQLDQLCAELDSPEEEARHHGAIGLRKLLSEEEGEPFLQRVIDTGAVPKLLALMQEHRYPQLQFEACWVISNIAYGSSPQCEAIVSKQGIDPLLQLLYDSHGPILEQALWGLGNIAGDCPDCRDCVIMKGGVECVGRVVENSKQAGEVGLGCWVLSNLCRGEIPPKYELVKSAIPLLGKSVVSGQLAREYLTSCLWALAIHSEGSKNKIRHLLKVENLVIKAIDLCHSSEDDTVVPALRVIGNISTGNEAQTDELLNNHVLSLLRRLLHHQKRSIRREACWTLSNICAGT